MPASQPAYAGVVTGSFVTSQARAAAAGPTTSASPSPLSQAAIGITFVAWLALGASMLARAIVVGRGPWGNMFEFSVAFSFSILGGYLFLQRRYPIRSIGFIPTGVALAMLLYASSLPSEIKPLVPALQNAPLLTIHVGMAVTATASSRRASRPGSRTWSRARTTGSPGCRRTRCSTRSPTGR